MNDDYITHRELDDKMQIYDSKIRNHIQLTQSELKSDFVQYVNDIIKNNKADIALITDNMNTSMRAMETKIDNVSSELSTAKTLIIIALIAEFITRMIW